MPFAKNAQRLTAVVSGITFLIILLALAIVVPDPTPFQYTVFRIILALAAAAFGATIPGFLEVTVPGIARATGAIALFLIVYFFSPAELVRSGQGGGPYLGPESPTPFVASTELPGVQGRLAGKVLGGVGELTVHLDSVTLSYPQPAPDGGDRYILYYRALLAEHEGDTWKTLYQSDKQQVGLELRVGETLSLGSKSLKLPVPSLTSLAGRWLAFEIGLATSTSQTNLGTTYAHTPHELF